ncbi:histidinol-phosphatase [Thamnocephalis sphaerospora]|uniref:Histidinol-phosphatase n=1 Tax=Thamnocephalis sphaerospora TaxID=78915 RepID=A0A4P9XPR4_9FUNG|nr:histidinol-phosphatase [Thamnocephalis sphaerospora]|eukprot:RKP08003.1 histidinol-phosphatase [Thamnocephalis sphaerospora]
MPFTLHTHSGQFCHHAHGTLEELVQAAVAAGLRTLGLSEHMPRQRVQDLYPEEANATPDSLHARFDAYVHEARRLRDKYANQLRILVGMETEYIYAEQATKVQALRARYSLDYVVGSVHHVHGHPIDFDAAMLAEAQTASGGTAETLVCAYFDAQRDMLHALRPEVVGHFDLIRRLMPRDTEWTEAVWQRVRENATIIASYGGLVEINTAAWKYGFADPYPQQAVIKILKAAGCRFTLSDDAHSPEQVAAFHNVRLRDYLARCNIDTVYALEPVDVASANGSAADGPFAKAQVVALDGIHHESFWTQAAR